MGVADLHIHTLYSFDGTSTVPAVLEKADRHAGLDVIAITDHDEICGALEAVELAPRYGIEVIPGSEVSTAEGHLLALFIRERIPPRLSLLESLLAIREQGGVAIAAHPADAMPASLSFRTIWRAAADPRTRDVLAGIEVFNAGLIHRGSNARAASLAHAMRLAPVGSSDAHLLWLIGRGQTGFPGKTALDLRHALENRTTQVVRGEGYSRAFLVLHWASRLFLRTFGAVSWCAAPQTELRFGRLPQIEVPR